MRMRGFMFHLPLLLWSAIIRISSCKKSSVTCCCRKRCFGISSFVKTFSFFTISYLFICRNKTFLVFKKNGYAILSSATPLSPTGLRFPPFSKPDSDPLEEDSDPKKQRLASLPRGCTAAAFFTIFLSPDAHRRHRHEICKKCHRHSVTVFIITQLCRPSRTYASFRGQFRGFLPFPEQGACADQSPFPDDPCPAQYIHASSLRMRFDTRYSR